MLFFLKLTTESAIKDKANLEQQIEDLQNILRNVNFFILVITQFSTDKKLKIKNILVRNGQKRVMPSNRFITKSIGST